MSGKLRSVVKILVMLGTKSVIREVRSDPSIIHFDLLYKDDDVLTNDS